MEEHGYGWKNNPANFHPDPIRNDAAIVFLRALRQQEKQEQDEEQQKLYRKLIDLQARKKLSCA